MASPDTSGTYLLRQFREFCSELIRLKQVAASGTWHLPPEGAPESDEQRDRPEAANPIWQRLLSLMEQQALDAGRSAGDYGFELYKEGQYVMAALADETFLHLEWQGREFWGSNLLESKLFGSHIAGELFFQKLERLLQNRDPVYTDVAAMYLMALALGFRGKFRGIDDGGQLNAYGSQIFSFLFHRKPGLGKGSRQLFPKAYSYTLEEAAGRRLPDTRKWIAALVIVILTLGVISHGLWTHLVADLDVVTQQILASR